MMYDHFDSMVNGISRKLEQDPDGINARKRYALAVSKLGRRLYSEGETIAWCGVTAPFDLLSAMGVTSCFVEFVGAMLSSMKVASPFMEAAEDAGFATDACAYHRAVMGAVLENAMPRPDFIIGTSCPCTAGLAIVENFARAYDKDFFLLNIPQGDSDGAVGYLAAQLEEMTRFIASHTGRALDRDNLAHALDCFNRCSDLLREVYALAMTRPSPVDNKLLKDFGTVLALIMGTEEGVEITRAFRDELAWRIKTGRHLENPEAIRLLWIQNRIQHPFPINGMLDRLGARIVVDELNDVTWETMDPDRPFDSIARRILSIPFSRSAGDRVAHLRQQARDYQVDAAVNPCHWGCRQGTGTRGLVSRGLKAEGVPVLNLEIDCVDARNLAGGQIETRLEAFVEMLS